MSNPSYAEASRKVRESYDNIRWISQDDIKQNVLDCIDESNEYTFFLVDDIVFYRKPEFLHGLLLSEDFCYSLRLGQNIVNCPVKHNSNGMYDIRWKWSEAKKYFSYPLSVDGHIFRTDQIRGLIEQIEFTNPNKLEAHLQRFKSRLQPYMMAGKQSCIVNMPINKVTDFSSTSFGEYYPMTASELLTKFNDGYRMDIMKMDFSDVTLCHQEIEPKFFKLK